MSLTAQREAAMTWAGRGIRYVLVAEDEGFVASCLEMTIASEGDTEDEAVENLREALELYFEGLREVEIVRVERARADGRR